MIKQRHPSMFNCGKRSQSKEPAPFSVTNSGFMMRPNLINQDDDFALQSPHTCINSTKARDQSSSNKDTEPLNQNISTAKRPFTNERLSNRLQILHTSTNKNTDSLYTQDVMAKIKKDSQRQIVVMFIDWNPKFEVQMQNLRGTFEGSSTNTPFQTTEITTKIPIVFRAGTESYVTDQFK